jgi:hypothetical protein
VGEFGKTAPTVAYGTVYFGSDFFGLTALDAATGQVRWSNEGLGEVRSSPIAANGLLYVVSTDGHLYVLDANNGEVLLDRIVQSVTENRGPSASPALAEGVLYVSTGDELQAYGLAPQGPVLSTYVDLTDLVDINGNGTPELAALLRLADGTPQVIIKDSDTERFIAKMDFGTPNQTVKGVTGLLDITGNGAPEVAVLLTRPDGINVVQMKDAKTGRWIDKMHFFGPEWETKAVTSQDLDLDGVSEVSVLAVRKDGKKAATQIRDSITKEQLNWIGWPVE